MAKPRAKTFRKWMMATNFSQQDLEDLANHGADTGWQGLTYTADTVELFDKYGDEIWEMLAETASGMGVKSVPALIATFNRIDMADTLDGFKNLCVWFAAEEIARVVAGD